MKERILWIDNMRGICSFCVLLAHCGCCPSFYLQLYTPFFLAGFFFLSGYCHKDRLLKEGFLRWCKKVLLPYIILATVLIAMSISNLKLLLHGDISGYASDLKALMLGRPLWFISCLAITQLYFLIINKFVKQSIIYLLISSVCFLIMFCIKNTINYPQSEFIPAFWYCDTAILGLAFYILGYVAKREAILIRFTIHKYWSIVAFVCYAIMAILCPLVFDVEFHFITNYYANYFYFLLMSFFGILVIHIIAKNINSKYLAKLGYNSLLLFAISGKINQIMQFCHIQILQPYLADYVYSILFCSIQGGAIIILSYFVNKYCPIIVGK